MSHIWITVYVENYPEKLALDLPKCGLRCQTDPGEISDLDKEKPRDIPGI